MRNLIALCGQAGSGKSTCAAKMSNYYGYTPVKFAGPLKDMLRSLGLSEKQIEGELKEVSCELLGGHTPRYAMQTLGTEWGRQLISTSLWVSAWKKRVEQIIRLGGKVVVDDCRFDNELLAVRALGGIAIRIERPGLKSIGAHVSESAISDLDMPVVKNDGDVFTLLERVIDAAGE